MKVLIHVGPPKTGTSAIQKWCLENRQQLLTKNIYYPKHDLDVNGVSSGNLLSLFDRDENGTIAFSDSKFQDVILSAKSKGADTILFSSEFFFKNIPVLIDKISECVLIAYIRFELDIIESNYKQSVKRHGQTDRINLPKFLRSNALNLLTQFIEQFGSERFKLRSYGEKAFFRHDLISDFLDSINAPDLISENNFASKNINSGYNAESLEYKRWFNKFHREELQAPLDHFLQKQALLSNVKYSLIKPDDFADLKAHYVQQLKTFCDNFEVNNGSILLSEAQSALQLPFKEQKQDLEVFKRITQDFVDDKRINFELMTAFINDSSVLVTSIEDKLKLQAIARICEAMSNQKRKLEKLFNYFYGKSYLATTSLVSRLKSSNRQQTNTNHHKEDAILLSKDDGCLNIELLSYNIPFTSDNSFIKCLDTFYGSNNLLMLNQTNGISELNSGSKIYIPNDVKAIHGNIKIHPKHDVYFPRAIRICWIRDPIERLWLHFESILNTKTPYQHYANIKNLEDEMQTTCKITLFKAMLESETFSFMTHIYTKYLGDQNYQKFDFIGSMNRYESDVDRLFGLINLNLNSTSSKATEKLIDALKVNIPEEIGEMKNLISSEYEAIADFL